MKHHIRTITLKSKNGSAYETRAKDPMKTGAER